MTAVESVWSSFRLDPRRPEHATLRASDADREVVSGVLADAYADGRLSAQEHDERETANQSAKTLGELPPLMADLVSPSGPASAPVRRESGSLRREATRRYLGSIWEAGAGCATPFLICAAIWLFTGGGYFWPVWVLFPVVLTVIPMVLRAPTRISRLERKIAEERRAELEGPRAPEEPTDPDEPPDMA